MTQTQPNHRPTVRPRTDYDPTRHQRAKDKTSRIPIKVERTTNPLKKPSWIRVKAAAPNSKFRDIKGILRETNLFTVCEEASCPNIGECFGKGTAPPMIIRDKCRRRCPLCDVAHGRPGARDRHEPANLARASGTMTLPSAGNTPVARCHLRAGGAGDF